MIICILGRQPAFGLAELESRFGADKISALGTVAAQVDVRAEDVPFPLLGSVIKFAEPLATFPTTEWAVLLPQIQEQLGTLQQAMPAGKIKLGFSLYELPVSLKQLQRSGLEFKKHLRSLGRSSRIVPNTALELNSAQILHNRLIGEVGCELVLIGDGRQTHLARTVYVQNIDDYARRDFGRPKRDAFVGMLPPKLAQTMLNLAQVAPNNTVLDPFCGTGVLLQEAALMGAEVYGTDVSERMIGYTRDNLAWLKATYNLHFEPQLAVADARTATWQAPIDRVVGEAYLGRPLTALPAPKEFQGIVHECDAIVRTFLANIRGQLQPGTRCCLALPAWFNGKNFLHVPVVDDLKKIGYNRISFATADNQQLIYHRPDQIVARDIVVLTVKE